MAKGSNRTGGINYTGGLKREFHHLKAMNGTGEATYEPTMILLREERKGCAFAIPLPCLWKYLEPGDNINMRKVDDAEFHRMAAKVDFKRQLQIDLLQTAEDCAAIIIAERLNESADIMLCTGYALAKCCQVLDIVVCPQSLIQILMFIQDGLDTLKNMPEHEEEESISAGEVIITIDGKTTNHEVRLPEPDLLYGGE